MAEDRIDLAGLPKRPAGNLDSIAGVDQATQGAALFPVTALPMPQGVVDAIGRQNQAIEAIRASQGSGLPSYATRASLPAPGTLPRPSGGGDPLVTVTNDSDPDNNGAWRDTGTAWVKSADRVSAVERIVQSVGFLINTASSVNFVTATRRLEISQFVVWLTVPGKRIQMPETDVALPTALGWHRIEYDAVGNEVVFSAYTDAFTPGRIVFGAVRILSGSPPFQVAHIDHYTIDGVVPEPEAKPVRGELSALAGVGVDFDWNAGFLRISPSRVRATFGQTTALLPAQNVSLPSPALSSWNRLVLNTANSQLSFKLTSASLTGAEVQVGLVNSNLRKVEGLTAYYENGQPKPDSDLPPLAAHQRFIVNGNTDAGYTSDPLPAFPSIATDPHTTIYAAYDALMAAHPSYVTRTLLGQDDASNNIYRYDFTPPQPINPSPAAKVPKMILASGVHGAEKGGIWSLYLALKAICDQWRDDERLETLRWNCNFIVVPVVTPHGFDNNTRKNENGVDVARNFSAGWAPSDPADPTYGGTAPLTEPQSQYLDAVMDANREAIAFWSFHSFGSHDDDTRFLWVPANTQFGMDLAKSLISRQSRAWKGRYSWLPQDDTTMMGQGNMPILPGNEGRQATETYSIQGGTFETRHSLPTAPDSSSFSSQVATMGAEAVVNWLLLNLQHATAFYDARI